MDVKLDSRFTRVGIRPIPAPRLKSARWWEGRPVISMAVLLLILLGCLCCETFMPKDPGYMDLFHIAQPPCREFLFGTDTMGRDIFSMIWYGGRVSLCIGFLATLISTFIAISLGALSGLSPKWLDEALMRAAEIWLSIPNLPLVVLIQAILGKANILSISIVIGVTGWASIAKVVRTEVRRMRESEYIVAARCMGAGFWRILWKHLAPNFLSSILFMIVMNIRGAIAAESTLSFMGLGLPLEVVSWGSMLSLSEKALSSGAWWIILIPGAFLVLTLLCVTNIGNYLRRTPTQGESKL